MRDLGTLPQMRSIAYAINNFGYVVGESVQENGMSGRAFLWTKSTGMVDLNTLISPDSGWELVVATGINVWGQITGDETI